ncbi:MAG: hypothetical protein V1809_08520 [Planctomycetota bacterium]
MRHALLAAAAVLAVGALFASDKTPDGISVPGTPTGDNPPAKTAPAPAGETVAFVNHLGRDVSVRVDAERRWFFLYFGNQNGWKRAAAGGEVKIPLAFGAHDIRWVGEPAKYRLDIGAKAGTPAPSVLLLPAERDGEIRVSVERGKDVLVQGILRAVPPPPPKAPAVETAPAAREIVFVPTPAFAELPRWRDHYGHTGLGYSYGHHGRYGYDGWWGPSVDLPVGPNTLLWGTVGGVIGHQSYETGAGVAAGALFGSVLDALRK